MIKESQKKANKKWKDKNKESIVKYNKNYKKAHKIRIKKQKKEWEMKNPEKKKAINKRHYLKRSEGANRNDGRSKNKQWRSWIKNKRNRMKRGANGNHTFGEWELLKKQYGYCCPHCGKCEPEIILTEDHIIPLSKGGSNWIENIQPLCGSCNSKKHTKIINYGRK